MTSLMGTHWSMEPPDLNNTAGIPPAGHDISISYRRYDSEADLPSIMSLVGSELSEPYVIYTYRYFLVNW